MGPESTAEVAALVATVLAAVGALPQLRRIVRTGDRRGVSLTSATLGVSTELAWCAYCTVGELWTALPEAALMTISNSVLVVVLVRRGALTVVAALAGTTWLAGLTALAFLGGPTAMALVLGVAYAVQLAPAVWTAWRTPAPTGVAAATWALVGAEGLLWGAYGLHHADPAIIAFAVTATVGGAAVLTRKAVTWPSCSRRRHLLFDARTV